MNSSCVYIFILTVCVFKVKYLQLALIIPKISLFSFHKDFLIRNPELTNISCVSISDQSSLRLNGLKNGIQIEL